MAHGTTKVHPGGIEPPIFASRLTTGMIKSREYSAELSFKLYKHEALTHLATGA